MQYFLENDKLKLEFDSKGAELTAITGLNNGLSYMWNAGDAWKRHSPVLFPIVGGIKDKTYHLNGNEYHLNQHGFARDMEFELLDRTEASISFVLKANEETLKLYPCKFELIISYTLNDNNVKVGWKVINTDNNEIWFSIGGHPAFSCPVNGGSQTQCYLHFNEDGPLSYNLLSNDGLCVDKPYGLVTDNGYVNIDFNFFDNDALVFYNEERTVKTVSLSGPDKKDYLKVSFDAPVYGIWSAKGKHAPFVCIEPWYGRCDAVDFAGGWQDRKFGNRLGIGETFEESYTIEVMQ